MTFILSPKNLQYMFTKGYVYIFITIISQNKFKRFTEYMNHQHSTTKFTFEVEQNNTFLFLDMTTSKNLWKNILETIYYGKCYKKYTVNSCVITNFSSCSQHHITLVQLMLCYFSVALFFLFTWKNHMDNLSDTYLSDFMRILETPPSARKQFTNESVIIDQI